MADHETRIKLTIEGDDNNLKAIADKIDQVMGETPYKVDFKVGADTSEVEAANKIIAKDIGKDNNVQVVFQVEGDEKLYKSLTWAQKRAEALGKESPVIKVDADTDEARSRINEVLKRIGVVDGEKASIKVNVNDNASDELDNIQKKATTFDGLSPYINPTVVGDAIEKLGGIQKMADDLNGQSPKIKPEVDTSQAIGEVNNLESAITGILGTVGAGMLLDQGVQTALNMDKAWRSWVGSLQHSGMALDQAKKKADGFYETVNNLASVGQSNDGFFKNIAGLMISANTNISDSSLKMTENVVAGYEMMRGKSGDTLYEMETELKNFLTTGETSRLTELESIGEGKWMPLLEGAKTAEERMKVLNDLLTEEGYMAALNIEAPSKSIDQLKAMFDAAMTDIGTSLINIIKPIADGLIWLDEVTNGASTSVLSTVAVVGLLGVGLAGLAGALSSVLPGFSNLTGAIARFIGISGSIPDGPDGSGGSKGGKGGGFLKWIESMNLMAMNAAKSTGPAALSWSTLSAGISSMLGPILQVSAVVAVVIVIIAALAAEALILLRGIGELVKALDFKSLDLKSNIEGIKQIGSAMWELFRAFTVLAGINIVNIVYSVTGGMLGTTLALRQFSLAIKEMEIIFKDLEKINIDKNSVIKIEQIKTILESVTKAMREMAGLNFAGLGTLLTGGVTAVKANIKNIEEIAKTISDMNIPDLKNKSAPIQSLATVLKNVQTATEAVNESLGWFNEKSLQKIDVTHFKSNLAYLGTIADIINASKIPNVSNKSESIKSMKDVLSNIKTSVESVEATLGTFAEKMLQAIDVEHFRTNLDYLATIADEINGHNFTDVSGKVQALTQLKTAITAIKDSAVTINDNLLEFIGMQLNSEDFKKAVNELYSINQHLNTKAFNLDTYKVTAITNLKTVVKHVADTSKSIIDNKDNFGDELGDTITKVKGAIDWLYSLNQHINTKPFEVTESILQGVTNLKTVVTAIKDIGVFFNTNLADIESITNQEATVKGAISSLYSINQHLNSMPFQIDEAKTEIINSLKSTIQAIIDTLKAAAGMEAAASNMAGKIVSGFKTGVKPLTPATVTALASAISACQDRYQTFYSAGNTLGAKLAQGFKDGAGINSPMAVVIYGLSSTLKYINSLAKDFYSAGATLGKAVQNSYRARGISTTKAGYAVLAKEYKKEIQSVYDNNLSGLNKYFQANSRPANSSSSTTSITNVFTNPLITQEAASWVNDVRNAENNRESDRS